MAYMELINKEIMEKTPKANMEVIENKNYLAVSVSPKSVFIYEAPKGMRVSDFLKQNPDASVAINGGYYDILKDGTYAPTGLLISESSFWQSSIKVSLGLDKKRQEFTFKAEKESAWTSIFSITDDGVASVLPTRTFESLCSPSDYENIRIAIEAGPPLLLDGKIASEFFSSLKTSQKDEIRSAIGVLENGNILFFFSKKGMTLEQVATEMKKLGALDAMALDSGISSALIKQGEEPEPGMPINTIIFAK